MTLGFKADARVRSMIKAWGMHFRNRVYTLQVSGRFYLPFDWSNEEE